MSDISSCLTCGEVDSSWPFRRVTVLNPRSSWISRGSAWNFMQDVHVWMEDSGFSQIPKGVQWPKGWRLWHGACQITLVPHHVLRPYVVSPEHFLLNLLLRLEWRAKFNLGTGKGLVSESMKQDILDYPIPTSPPSKPWVFTYQKEERDLCFYFTLCH